MTARTQRGGTLAGLVIGIVVGLAIALAVAVYVSKVPIPFLSTGGSRLVDKDASEAQRNKDWDPNAPLYGGRSGAQPAVTNTPAGAAPVAPAVQGQAPGAVVPPDAGAAAESDPLGDLARARAQGKTVAAAPPVAPPAAPATSDDPYTYFIQAGAFGAPDEADAQRAQLAMLGWEAKVSQGQRSGSAVYRVRIGPFARRDDADQLKGKLDSAGVASILVRVKR